MKKRSVDDYVQGIKNKDIAMLSLAISLVESSKEEHQKMSKELLKKILPLTGKAKRIGITGTPGVGKSTFIESFGISLIDKGLKVAVLAIDPSSQKTGGSILGDKTRMMNLASHKDAFIRPTPSGSNLGGVAWKTREAMLLCEAYGFDVVIIETVGVGQSEVSVKHMVDYFLLLMQPGAGDDLQGIKRGILEVADLVAVNKADGEGLSLAMNAKNEYESAIHILRGNEKRIPKVLTCSALEKTGLDTIWNDIKEFYKSEKNIDSIRLAQFQKWFHHLLNEKILDELIRGKRNEDIILEQFTQMEKEGQNILVSVDETYQRLSGKSND